MSISRRAMSFVLLILHYDPVMKRMICADNEAITAESTLKDNNIFTYCDNNPVNN